MKNIKFLAFAFAAFLLVGCEDYFGSDSNVDPDNPISVTESVILPQVQARLAYTYGGDISRYTSLFTQHSDGIARQHFVLGQYGFVGSDCDAAWSNVFTGTLQSNRRMIQQAEEKGFNHYAGIGKAIEAYTMLAATDVWGDLPYSDAFRFDEVAVYSPTFDTQESIYNAILALIDEARGALLKDDGGSPVGNGDLYYGGDASKWVTFLNVLEARANLHLTKRNGAAAYAAVLEALNKGDFQGAGDEFAFSYGSGATENAPWFQWNQQRGDTEVGAGYLAIMAQFNDPRAATYGASHASHPIFTANQRDRLLSYTEQLFMRAEAELMKASPDRTAAYDAYLAGIESSMNEAGLSDPATAYADYVAQTTVGVGASNLTLNNIITQKYIALLVHPETFTDWRRTGFPALTPTVGSAIPRRLPYAQTEVFSNDNLDAPPSNFIYTPVWWDE